MKPIQYVLLISLLSATYLLPEREPERTLKPLVPKQALACTEIGNSKLASFEALQKDGPRPAARINRLGPDRLEACVNETIHPTPDLGVKGRSRENASRKAQTVYGLVMD